MNKLEKPHLNIVKADALHLSNFALSQLMQAVLAKGYPFRFKARGFSMHPFIKDGDVIVISPIHKTEPKFGDILAFIHPQTKQLVVHRMVGKYIHALFIQGDNIQEQTDGIVPMSNLLGRVTRIERNGNVKWFGLGNERYIIAFLSRVHLLIPILRQLSCFRKPS